MKTITLHSNHFIKVCFLLLIMSFLNLKSEDLKVSTEIKDSSGMKAEIKLGLGLSEGLIVDNNKFGTWNLSFGAKFGNTVFSIIGRWGLEAVGFTMFGPSNIPRKTYTIWGFTMGQAYTFDFLYISASGGIGFLNGIERGPHLRTDRGYDEYYTEVKLRATCFPIKIEVGIDFGVFGLTFTKELTISKYKPVSNSIVSMCLLF